MLCLAMAVPAQAESPDPKLKPLPDETAVSPDRQVSIEQYVDQTTDDWVYQFWAFDSGHQNGFLLNPGETTDTAGYAAGFRFSADSRWVVRTQKLGAGYHTLFLYRRDGLKWPSATTKPLGDMAWDYFFSLPVSKRLHREAPEDRTSLDHQMAHLMKGFGENFAWLGVHWPDSRYVVISLSFDAQGEDKPKPWIEDWWCRYDMTSGEFSVPREFDRHNADTFRKPPPKARRHG